MEYLSYLYHIDIWLSCRFLNIPYMEHIMGWTCVEHVEDFRFEWKIPTFFSHPDLMGFVFRWNTRFFPRTFSHTRCFFLGFSSNNSCWNSLLATYCSYLQHLFKIPKMTGRDFRCEISEIPHWFGSRPHRPKGFAIFCQAQFASLLWISQRTTWALPPSKAWRWPCSCDVILEIISVLEVFIAASKNFTGLYWS